MQKIKKYMLLFVVFALSQGCAHGLKNDVPNWLSKPAHNQAVGSCGPHALGKQKQKECAMTRARVELASRKGIDIRSTSLMTEQANAQRSQSQLLQHTEQTINEQIKARLVETYHDKAQDILWVLMQEE